LINVYRLRPALGVVVKRKAENIGANLPVSFREEQVLMPYLVNDL
jgi:hypothetical protein